MTDLQKLNDEAWRIIDVVSALYPTNPKLAKETLQKFITDLPPSMSGIRAMVTGYVAASIPADLWPESRKLAELRREVDVRHAKINKTGKETMRQSVHFVARRHKLSSDEEEDLLHAARSKNRTVERIILRESKA